MTVLEFIERLEGLGVAGLALTGLWMSIKFIKEQLKAKDNIYEDNIAQLKQENEQLRNYTREDYKETAGVLREVSNVLDKVMEAGKTSTSTISKTIAEEAQKTRSHVTDLLNQRDATP